jgi:2-isopropylmalate synthase
MLYQHEEPGSVGNDMRMLVSDMAGRASIELKGRELGYDLAGNTELLTRVTDKVKDLESRGYTFEAADASFELLLRAEVEGATPDFFDVESWRVIVDAQGDAHQEGSAAAEATVKVRAGGERLVAVGEGNGPVNALDHALRAALGKAYPELAKLELIDYRVRIVDQAHGTDAVTRVLVETSDGETSWETVGVHANVIEASWEALLDAVTYGLLRHAAAPSAAAAATTPEV